MMCQSRLDADGLNTHIADWGFMLFMFDTHHFRVVPNTSHILSSCFLLPGMWVSLSVAQGLVVGHMGFHQ